MPPTRSPQPASRFDLLHGTPRAHQAFRHHCILCPACGGEMKIISLITLPSTVQRILLRLDLPHRPPRVSPARGPPQAEPEFDQSPAFDLAAPEPIPDYEFDPSPPHDWDA